MSIAKHLEHTLLKPEATVADIIRLCDEAVKAGVYGVCINPCYVEMAKHYLGGEDVKVITVLGFPLGASTSAEKSLAASVAVLNHADELDMVMNIGAFKTGDYKAVEADISAVVRGAQGLPVKVIIETCLLNDEEKIKACELIAAAGAQFVKTSTGFNKGGATLADVKLLKGQADKLGLKVKAAGGIRDYQTAKAMLEAGAERIGTSAGAKIVLEEAGASGAK
jgi:deoxyribose-phosphate aldolase